MPLVVERLPTLEAAEECLSAFVGSVQTEPIARVNVLTGSNAQRIYFRRTLGRHLGATANVRFSTPIDLASEVRRAAAPPARLPLPDGGDILVLAGLMRELRESRRLTRLDPEIQGVPEAVLGSITDLREGGVSAQEFAGALRRQDERKLHELSAIYRALEEGTPFLDRPGIYQDALDPRVSDEAVREALGSGPLAVIGLYDATPVQVALIQRCAQVTPVRALVVAPAAPEFAFAQRFAETLEAAGTAPASSEEAGDQLSGEFDGRLSLAHFSAPTRQAEAEAIARRILALAREQGVAFDEMAVLHRLDHGYDDLLTAVLERAGVPVYRGGGLPVRHSAAGRAVLVLLDLLLETPTRHRLLEFLASPALRPAIPPGVTPQPVRWERVSKKAGMVREWERFGGQVEAHIESLEKAETSSGEAEAARGLRDVVRGLHTAAAACDGLATWADYSAWFVETMDAYLASGEGEAESLAAARGRIEALAQLDRAELGVDASRFRQTAARAVRRALLSGGYFQRDGVFVGNVVAARSLRFQAVFLAECAERIFPPLIRQDPLLLDGEREQINRRLGHVALPLKRERQQEEEMLFALVQQSARRFLTLSWARRTSASGAPRLPSTYLLESVPGDFDELARVDDLVEQGRIQRLPARLAGAAPSTEAIAAGDWSATAQALDESDFRRAVLAAAPHVAPRLLRELWAGYERYERARASRNEARFGEYDGVIDAEAAPGDLLKQATTPTELETYATCPYRYFMKRVLNVAAVPEPGEALEMTPLDRGTLVHAILERWVRDAIDEQADWPTYLRNHEQLMQIAQEEFARADLRGLAGHAASWNVMREEILGDLERVLKAERQRAEAGYRPERVEMRFQDVDIPLPDGTSLRFSGRIDRVDRGPEGLVATDYKTGSVRKQAADYVSGAALQLPIYLRAAAHEFGVEASTVRAEYWYATRKGNFTRSGLSGADIERDDALGTVLATISEGIRAGRFFPYPGRGSRRRPNCTYCDYLPVCATDVDRRFDAKQRQDQATVRDFLTLQARRP